MDQMKIRYCRFLKSKEISEELIEKSYYALCVIYFETAKFLGLFLLFLLIGKGKEFLLANISVFSLRTSLGGKHFSTQKACFFASLAVFSGILFLEKEFPIPIWGGMGIFLTACVTVFFLAPLPSKERPKYSKRQKRKFKIKGIIAIIVLNLLGILLPDEKNVILWAVTVQVLEAVLVTISRKGGKSYGTEVCKEG